MPAKRPSLLAIVELGGYPNFTSLYERLGFDAEFVNSQRRAQARLKKGVPDVIVAEFNFQSDFRDRTSNLESLMARLQGERASRVVVFYQQDQADKFERRSSVLTGLGVTTGGHVAALHRADAGVDVDLRSQ